MRAAARLLPLLLVLAGTCALAWLCRAAGFGLGVALAATPASALALAAAVTLRGPGALAAGAGFALAAGLAGLPAVVAAADGAIHAVAAAAGAAAMRGFARRRRARSWTGDWLILLAGAAAFTATAAAGVLAAAELGRAGSAIAPARLALAALICEPLGILSFGIVLANLKEARQALADRRAALGMAGLAASLLVAFDFLVHHPIEGMPVGWVMLLLSLPLAPLVAMQRRSFAGAVVAFLTVTISLTLLLHCGRATPDSVDYLASVISLTVLLGASHLIHVLNRDRLAALAEVEARVAERTERLGAMTRQAVEASAAKSRLLATVSHEIRTPLNGVLGMTAVVLAGPLDAAARRNVEIIRGSGFHLLTVVNRILDFARIEGAPAEAEAEPFDLAELVEEVLAEARFLPFAPGLDLRAELAPGLAARRIGPRAALRQVLTNLVANACRFTDAGSVVLRATEAGRGDKGGGETGLGERGAGETGGGGLRIEVQDTGRGVAPAEQDRIFRPFEQAGERRGGTGLGLAICAEIVERMGGRIGVASAPGAGALFWVEAPLPADLPALDPPLALRA